MTTPAFTQAFRVTGIMESTPGRVIVNLIQDGEPSPGATNLSSLGLNLTTTEAQGYFPGDLFTITVTEG